MNNKERASARDKKQRRRNSLEEQLENSVSVLRKWEMLAASKVKMRGSEEEKKQQN